jgi:hypothetical protein
MQGLDLDSDSPFASNLQGLDWALNVRIKTCLEALPSPCEKATECGGSLHLPCSVFSCVRGWQYTLNIFWRLRRMNSPMCRHLFSTRQHLCRIQAIYLQQMGIPHQQHLTWFSSLRHQQRPPLPQVFHFITGFFLVVSDPPVLRQYDRPIHPRRSAFFLHPPLQQIRPLLLLPRSPYLRLFRQIPTRVKTFCTRHVLGRSGPIT